MSNSGPFNNSGTLNITRNPGGGGDFTNSGTLNNAGGTFSNNVTSTIYNTGIINNTSGANLMNAGTINNAGIFANSGAVMISITGLFTTSTNYTQTSGSTFVNGILTATGGAIVNIQGGTLGGTGTINGNVAMGGTIMPAAPGTPGTLTIFGNYEQTENGTLCIWAWLRQHNTSCRESAPESSRFATRLSSRWKRLSGWVSRSIHSRSSVLIQSQVCSSAQVRLPQTAGGILPSWNEAAGVPLLLCETIPNR
jgi:hypothetical protein